MNFGTFMIKLSPKCKFEDSNGHFDNSRMKLDPKVKFEN